MRELKRELQAAFERIDVDHAERKKVSGWLSGVVRRVPGCVCLLLIAAATPAFAGNTSDQAAISLRFTQWAQAFNSRNANLVCDLFSPDLIATVRGAPERGRAAVCAQLAAAMARGDRRLRYTPDIREILVSGDLAVVRVVWTLNVQLKRRRETNHEFGMDVFRKQPNGKWSIIRYISY